MEKKQLVIMFDLDGTLLDTNELIFESFRYTFAKYMPEKKLTEEELLSFLGPPLGASFERFFPKEMVPEIVDYYRVHNHDHHKAYVTMFPTVKETIQELKKRGYLLAIVTTKLHSVAQIGLDLFELTPYFDLILGMDDVEFAKPNPDSINRCLKHFDRSKGIMIGDSTADIMAGKNAGVYTAGVEWTFKPVEVLTQLEPDFMLKELKDIIEYAEILERK